MPDSLISMSTILVIEDYSGTVLSHSEMRPGVPLREGWNLEDGYLRIAAYTPRGSGYLPLSLDSNLISIQSCEQVTISHLTSIVDEQAQMIEPLIAEWDGVNSALEAFEDSQRESFRDPDFSVAGDFLSEKVQAIIDGIFELNHGQQQALYLNLGGSLNGQKKKK